MFLIALVALTLASPVEEMSQQVIEERQAVEVLNEKYKTEKEKVYNDLKSIGARKAELDTNIQSDELQLRQLQGKVQKLKQDIKKEGALSEDMTPLFQAQAKELKAYVEGSIPFKKADRLEAISSLETRLHKGQMSSVRALIELWSLIQDEKRMAKESVLEKQVVAIDGKDTLVHVARLGMMAMYFSTEKDRYGEYYQDQGKWQYRLLDNEKEIGQVRDLILSLKKQVKTGYFLVPSVRKG